MVTLNAVGDFRNPWAGKPDEEIRHLSEKTWSPGTDAFESVCKKDGRINATAVSSFSQFLGHIEKQGSGTIQLINVFTHADFGLIAFCGDIVYDKENKRVKVSLDEGTGLDLRIGRTDPIPLRSDLEEESLGTVARRLQSRFARGAQIVFYACNSGVDLELLQEIANAFQVKVKGFSHPIWYCPEWSKVPGRDPTIDRGFTSSNKCMTKKRGFDHLFPDRSCVPRKQ